MMELVRGSVMTLSRSGAFSPVWILKDSMTRWVSLYRTPVATSRGRRTSTDSQLKKSWTVAPAKALQVKERTVEHVPDPVCRVVINPLLNVSHDVRCYKL